MQVSHCSCSRQALGQRAIKQCDDQVMYRVGATVTACNDQGLVVSRLASLGIL